jgi:hypothetical protein
LARAVIVCLHWVQFSLLLASGRRLGPSNTARRRESISFFVRVAAPGVYFLAFSAPLVQEEHELSREAGVNYAANRVGKKYVVVA